MKRPILKLITAIIVIAAIIMTLIFSAGYSDKKEALDNKAFTASALEIPLPDEDLIVHKIRIEEDGSLMLAGFKRNEEMSENIVFLWKTKDMGERWEKLYEKKFLSEKPGEIIIEAIPYFAGNGVIIKEVSFAAEEIFDSTAKLHYIEDLKNGDEKELFDSDTADSLSEITFISEEKVYAEDYREGATKKLNLKTESVETVHMEGMDMGLYAYFNERYAYVTHYILSDSKASEEGVENEYFNKPEEFYSKYSRGKKYDMVEEEVVEAPVFDKFAAHVLLKEDKIDYRYGVSFAASPKADREEYYMLYDEGLFRFDESGETLVYQDDQWKKTYGQLSILYVGEDDIYIGAFKEGGDDMKEKLIKIALQNC